MAKTDRTVARNHSYQKKSISIRERHNERKNENYSNPDIELERSHMNIISANAKEHIRRRLSA